MTKPETAPWDDVEKVMQELVEFHQMKLLQCGRRIIPTLTPEDMLQPNDYPDLENNPHFRYEEGMLAGVQTAQMALRAFQKACEIVKD